MAMSDDRRVRLQESAFTTDLSLLEVTARFWSEVRPLNPNGEVHVVDPYLLDPGRRTTQVHAANVAALLSVLVQDIPLITLVHGKPRDGVAQEVTQNLHRLMPSGSSVRFVRPPAFHHRWVVADRERLAVMDLSFNQIGSHVGGIHRVNSERDRMDFCAALEAQDPHTT